MIVRPVHRPRPIPFAAPAAGATATRPVSWASASGPSAPAAAESHKQAHAAVAPAVPRLSPVKLAPAPREAKATPQHVAPASTPTLTGISAKYMGHGALSVRSSVTGRHYRFQGHGDCLSVDKLDLMLLRRIPDLLVT